MNFALSGFSEITHSLFIFLLSGLSGRWPSVIDSRLKAMELALSLLQWPAMAASIVAAWLVASRASHTRNVGFWVFILSNVLWILWGWHDRAYALIALQVGLLMLNLRGTHKNDGPSAW